MRRTAIVAAAIVAAGTPAAAAAHLQMERVSPTVYMVRPAEGDQEAVSNAAFVLLPDRVLLFDTLASPALMQEMQVLIRSVTRLPIGMVALSHWHFDHSSGLELLGTGGPRLFAAPGTAERLDRARADRLALLEQREREILRQERAAVDSAQAGPIAADLREVRRELDRLRRLPPVEADVLVDPSTDISLGDRVLLLQHPGPGHTAGDLMLYVATERVLLAGDLVSVRTLPNLSDAYTTAWLRRLDEIERMNPEKIVPGHGPLGSLQDVAALRRYLETLRSLVRPIAEQGTPRDLVEKLRVPGPFDAWAAQELWFPATLRVFNEMKGLVPPPAGR
jgi:glyoxylase-like metal-dependent hydrolase (beta-lactamase superfamily II)